MPLLHSFGDGIWSSADFVDTEIRCLTDWRVGMQTRKFSREFKLEAVRLVKGRGVAVAQAARDLDVHENVLEQWVRELSTDPQHAFPRPWADEAGAAGD